MPGSRPSPATAACASRPREPFHPLDRERPRRDANARTRLRSHWPVGDLRGALLRNALVLERLVLLLVLDAGRLRRHPASLSWALRARLLGFLDLRRELL